MNMQICEHNKWKYMINHNHYLQTHIVIFYSETTSNLFSSLFFHNFCFIPCISMC